MDYLLKKSDGSATNLNGTVSRLQLPDQTDTIFPGDQRPVDLGDYVLVKAKEVTQEVTSGKKRGSTTVTTDKDKETVTVTYTAVAQTDAEHWASIRTKRDNLIAKSDWTVATDTPLSDSVKAKWVTYRKALRDLPASESDPDDITWPDAPS